MNDKFTKVYKILMNLLQDSSDLLNDFMWIIKTQHPITKSTILLTLMNRRSIWFNIFQNKHLDKNYKIIKKLLVSYISNNFDSTINKDFTNHWKMYMMNKGIGNLLELDSDNENVLIYLLKRIFTNPDGVSDMSFATPKSMFRDYGLTYLSVSPDTDSDEYKTNIKIMLHKLLKLTVNHMPLYYQRYDLRPYYSKIFAYKNSLMREYDIDLDKYKFNPMKKTPVAYADKSVIDRSIENEKYIPRFHKEHKDIFSGFLNTKLRDKLLSIYMRTVEGVVENKDIAFTRKIKYIELSPEEKKQFQKEQSKNGILRIAKIQRYLSKMYMAQASLQPKTDFMDVVVGTEAEILFNAWKLVGKPILNRPYNIKFKDFRGTIDAGGPSKQFFYHISTQIQAKYFRVINQTGANRWIFKENITEDEAEFIGQLLVVFIKYNIHLPFAISKLYIAHLMFKIERITLEHLHLYYILDSSEDTRNRLLLYCKETVGKRKIESYVDTDYCNSTNIYNDQIVPTYNYNKKIMNAFSKGFFIDKGIFQSKFYNIDDRIRLYDLDKMISRAKLTKLALKTQIFNKLTIKYGANYETRETISIDDAREEDNARTKVCREFEELMTKAKKNDFNNYYTTFLGTIDNQEIKTKSEDFKDNKKFKSSVLLFWSAIDSISFTQSYKIIIHPSTRYPSAGTCATELILPENADKQSLYNDFMTLFSTGFLEAFGNL
jgi:hypothetical protein